MKRLPLLLFALILPVLVSAQRTIAMRNIWTRPQVHVLFQGYTLSFTIKDIDKALLLLAETGDSTFGTACGLDTTGDYVIELFPGLRMEYRKPLQAIMQKGVGAFLLEAGRSYIEDQKHRPVRSVISDVKPPSRGVNDAYILFTDPRNDNPLFCGSMSADMYHKDLGLD